MGKKPYEVECSPQRKVIEVDPPEEVIVGVEWETEAPPSPPPDLPVKELVRGIEEAQRRLSTVEYRDYIESVKRELPPIEYPAEENLKGLFSLNETKTCSFISPVVIKVSFSRSVLVDEGYKQETVQRNLMIGDLRAPDSKYLEIPSANLKKVASHCFNGKLSVSLQSYLSLHPTAQLDDEIIYKYLLLVAERSNDLGPYSKDLPRIHVVNSHFVSMYRGRNGSEVPLGQGERHFFTSDIIFFPVHIEMKCGGHWALIAVDRRLQTICYYDSLFGFLRAINSHKDMTMVHEYLRMIHLEIKKTPLPSYRKKAIPKSSMPQQSGDRDCGVFLCMTAEHLARDAPLEFTQQEMPYFRLLMMAEIAERKLLPRP
jgi:sentrin-specific protease 1